MPYKRAHGSFFRPRMPIAQIIVDRAAQAPGVLKFTHHVWFTADIVADGEARELGVRDADLSMAPSSIAHQTDLPAGNPVFPADSLVITSFFGGGIYTLTIK